MKKYLVSVSEQYNQVFSKRTNVQIMNTLNLGLYLNQFHLLDSVKDEKLKAILLDELRESTLIDKISSSEDSIVLVEWKIDEDYYLYDIRVNSHFSIPWISSKSLDKEEFPSIEMTKQMNLDVESEWGESVFNHFIREMHETSCLDQLVFMFPNRVEHLHQKFKYQCHPGMRVIDYTVESMTELIEGQKVFPEFKVEKLFFGDRPIRYVLQKAQQSDYLMVVFSAMSADEQARYNYLKSFQQEPYHKLFILDDFGQRGNFNVGVNGDHTNETSVVALLNQIVQELGLSLQDVIALGTSKGGGIATYFALKYRFAGLIVGGSVYQIGDWMVENKEERYYMKKTMSSLSHHDSDLQRLELNKLVYKFDAAQKANTKVFIQTVENDPYREGVLNPFLRYLDKHHYSYELNIYPGKRHNLLGESYPPYVKEVLMKHFPQKLNIERDDVLLTSSAINNTDQQSSDENATYVFQRLIQRLKKAFS